MRILERIFGRGSNETYTSDHDLRDVAVVESPPGSLRVIAQPDRYVATRRGFVVVKGEETIVLTKNINIVGLR